MKAARFIVTLLAFALVLTGCGGDDSSAGSTDDGSALRGRTFLSTAVTENGQPRPLAEATTVTFRFTDDGRLLADAGCNTMAGPVSLRGGRIEVRDLASTGVGCDTPRHEQDSWLSAFLSGAPSWRLDGANLVVSSESTEFTMLDKTVAQPDLALAGTRWNVDTIVEGDVASSTPAGAPASLTFEQDTVGVDTGCNSGSGGYEVSGDTIRFDAITTTRMACEPERMALETAVLTVLTGQVTFEIDADVMTLKHQSGKGLRLRGIKG